MSPRVFLDYFVPSCLFSSMSWVSSSTTASATTAGCQGCARGRGSRAGGDVHRADRDTTALASMTTPQSQHSGLVFTTELGRPVDPRNLLRVIEVVAEAAGVEHVGLHTLRHSAAVAWLESGVHIKAVADLLGHSSIRGSGPSRPHIKGLRCLIDLLGKR